MATAFNNAAFAILIISLFLIFLLPRRWAFVPLVTVACYITQGQALELGPFTFTPLRILTLAGIVRTIIRGEPLSQRTSGLDWILLLWACWYLISTWFRVDGETEIVSKLGDVFDACGLYFLVRTFCCSITDIFRLVKVMLVILVPVGLSMVYEVATISNPFSYFGGVKEVPMIREGKVRASGPFRHPILAGTVGAIAIPMAASLRHSNPMFAKLGCVAPLLMVYASASSGPVMTVMAALVGLFMWPLRNHMSSIRAALVLGYVALDLIMKAPAYFLLARIDITGGSTGHHRAALIQAAFNHLGEWWLAGTNYTRHWMPTGVSWSEDHVDITNQYIVMGVNGGMMSMLLYIALIAVGFSAVGTSIKRLSRDDWKTQFSFWALGSTLFSHATTFISVSYFDQSRFFFYLLLASIGSASANCIRQHDEETICQQTGRHYWPIGSALASRISQHGEETIRQQTGRHYWRE